MNLRQRADASAASVNLAALHLTKALTEVPFRMALPTSIFEVAQQFMNESETTFARYAMAHPWLALTGACMVDREFWEVTIAGAKARPLEVVR